ncbi:tetraprenyl-beta-curcumene synthase family protein [Cytobacillus purgationiresistens]|uniref:Tetraprenyl-beta-curcumene synthase n=1 Tax=Cytobacillus purgationiresistens TaxID=863449 RepID=A0ABU0ALW8_9BACI|nr:tetraprenyl-beta-curcumene synthase family protein [Cytobacillus purgationiresistens]MDQ0272258.1 tetraprenyl-beta-curcumene synthase [Cytobacillus purgationiresistens]
MNVPIMPISLMVNVYRKVMPAVNKELHYWQERANEIPDSELRKQALHSIEQKAFHCEGGAIMALLSKEAYLPVIKFIVAYQTISDYLDNLCDRSTSLDPNDFKALHEAMIDALTVDEMADSKNYYRFRNEQDDGGYLEELASTCREVLKEVPNYQGVKAHLIELCQFYCDLQIHKHVMVEERVPRLKSWHEENQKNIPKMAWYEFSACSGSTLGIFCLVSYAMRSDFEDIYGEKIRAGYFPYIQGLHILLDYLIDQEEDREAGDLNFCFYYENEQEMFERIRFFVAEADKHTSQLPHKRFHLLINRGLLGVYLSDEKVNQHHGMKKLAKKIIRTGGLSSFFFYMNGRAYRAIKNRFSFT